MISDASRAGLAAAARRLADAMRFIAVKATRRGAEAVNIHWDGDAVEIRAGEPSQPYGWEPIQPLMFEDNLRHPLFGNRRKWYPQGYYPITKLTLLLAEDDAVNDFADVAVQGLIDEIGL